MRCEEYSCRRVASFPNVTHRPHKDATASPVKFVSVCPPTVGEDRPGSADGPESAVLDPPLQGPQLARRPGCSRRRRPEELRCELHSSRTGRAGCATSVAVSPRAGESAAHLIPGGTRASDRRTPKSRPAPSLGRNGAQVGRSQELAKEATFASRSYGHAVALDQTCHRVPMRRRPLAVRHRSEGASSRGRPDLVPLPGCVLEDLRLGQTDGLLGLTQTAHPACHLLPLAGQRTGRYGPDDPWTVKGCMHFTRSSAVPFSSSTPVSRCSPAR